MARTLTTGTPRPAREERLGTFCRSFEKHMSNYAALTGAQNDEVQFMVTWSLPRRDVLDCARRAGIHLSLDTVRPSVYKMPVPELPEHIEAQIAEFSHKLGALLKQLEKENFIKEPGHKMFGNTVDLDGRVEEDDED